MWPKTFRESFCERFGCPPEAFERRVFWRCLYRRSLPLSLVVYLVNRNYFALDLQTIKQLGVARSLQEFRGELESFRYEYRMRRSEEHTSELQSRGLISYAVFCLKKKTK